MAAPRAAAHLIDLNEQSLAAAAQRVRRYRPAKARALAGLYNGKGIFHNRDDRLADLEAALEHSLTDVELKTTGCVALFAGRTPA